MIVPFCNRLAEVFQRSKIRYLYPGIVIFQEFSQYMRSELFLRSGIGIGDIASLEFDDVMAESLKNDVR